MTTRKPWLDAKGQVAHLKSKGTRFEFMSELEAISYLENNNNYFRLRSYRTGFTKVEEGPRKGQYTNLDFIMLVDLSIIDMLLRYEMLPLTLDIEHFSKIRLLCEIEKAGEDGYGIVQGFLSQYDQEDSKGHVVNLAKDEIGKGKDSPYTAGLLGKYPDFDFPAWVFIEVIAYGTFCYFYKYCAKRFENKDMMDGFYLLQSVKNLRNACAHNNCIINDMAAGKPKYPPRYSVSEAVGKVPGIGAGQRKAKLSNERLLQIATTLYMHKEIASDGVREHRIESLAGLANRMNMHLEYYNGNDQILSGFAFLTKLIDSWFT